MSTQPGTYDLTAYRDAKFPFQFTFQDGDEQALDLSTYTAVKYNFFTLSNQNDPEVTVEATVASNVVSGELTAEQTKSFYNKVIYYQGRFTRADGGDDILMDGRLFVTNVPGSAKEADAVVTVLSESGKVTVVGIISVAEAIAAKVAAEAARDETIAAADQAIIDIGNAKDSAIVDISNARDTGLTAISDAESSGVQAVNDAKDSAITEINALVGQAESARDDAQTAATTATTQAGNASDSADSASNSATTATEQAGIATTQAGVATDEANRAETEANKVINSLVQLGLVTPSHRDYTFAIIAQDGAVNEPFSTKNLFES